MNALVSGSAAGGLRLRAAVKSSAYLCALTMCCSTRLRLVVATLVALSVILTFLSVPVAVLTPQVLSLVSGAYYTYVYHAYTKANTEEMTTLKRHYLVGCVKPTRVLQCHLFAHARVCLTFGVCCCCMDTVA